jgi:hypothetical protein
LGETVFNGVLSSNQLYYTLQPNCVEDFSTISVDVNNTTNNNNWTSIAEMKLFANTTIPVPPPVEPPVCSVGQHYDQTQDKCVPDDVIPEPEEPPVVEPSNATTLIFKNTKLSLNVTDSVIDLAVGENTTINLPEINTTAPDDGIIIVDPNADNENEEDEDEEEQEENEEDGEGGDEN